MMRLIWVLLASLLTAGLAQGQGMDYATVVGDNTLETLENQHADHPFGDTLWILNETEHGSNGPERLYAFADLLNNAGRTPELDAAFLTPWLLRYIWEVPHPRYTAAAWPVFMQVVGDEADVSAIVTDILKAHPHGDLRAAVLEPAEDRHYSYQESDAVLALLPDLMVQDPDPTVRIAAVQLLAFVGYFDPDRFDLDAMLRQSAETDAAPQVRAEAMAALGGIGGQKPDRDFLIGMLTRPENRSVLPRLVPSVLQHVGYGQRADAALVAAAFNVGAMARGEPRFGDVIDGFGWATLALSREGRPSLNRWLAAAPFADGPALLAFLEAQFADASVPAADRVLAVALLHRLGVTPRPQAVFDLLMDDKTDAIAFQIASEVGWPLRPVVAARTAAGESGLGVLQALFARALAGTVDDRAAASMFRQRLAEVAIWAVVNTPTPNAPSYLATALDMIRKDDSDLSFALYDLRRAGATLDLSGLADVVLHAKNYYAAAGTAETIAARYAETSDAAMLPMLLRVLGETDRIAVVGGIGKELPGPETLVSRPQDLQELQAALGAAVSRFRVDDPQYYELYHANDWLERAKSL